MQVLNHPMVGPGGVRPLTTRWVITGDLVLDSATHLGSGVEEAKADMVLVQDRADGSPKPLLQGSSLAGGLRSFALDLLCGYGQEETGKLVDSDRQEFVTSLFGGARGDDEGGQSALIVFDSIFTPPQNWTPEIRDGVSLQPETALAEDHKKYDLEVLPRGTTFPIRFELLVTDTSEEESLISLLTATLKGLETGEIPIGARRSRGLGACHATNWRAVRFNLETQQGWFQYLRSDHVKPFPKDEPKIDSIEQAVNNAYPNIVLQTFQDNRSRIQITVCLNLQGGLLIRSPGSSATEADTTHITSGGNAVLTGTSLAGALRARALRIAQTVRKEKKEALAWIDAIFGPRLEGTTDQNFSAKASRLKVTENPVIGGTRLRPTRIKIDRFTGGVIDGALFEEEPIYGGQIEVSMELHQPMPGELGLLLLLLKDLLTGDLPVGGTSAVGRGILKGQARLTIDGKAYCLDPDQKTDPSTIKFLNDQVRLFHDVASIEHATENTS